MRLICPNCGAQYEIANDVIPENGRDVQCSNCGHTWLETRGASEAEDTAVDVTAAAIVHDDPDFEDDEPADVTPAENIAATPAPQRQELDTSIADILKEEAAREHAARKMEQSDALDEQPELGLDEGIDPSTPSEEEIRAQETRQRVARIKGEEVAATAAVARSELLPDIEEINATLRSSAERGDSVAVEEAEQDQRRGFRFGFSTILVIFGILALLYVFAPQISDAVPQMADMLSSYVDMVDRIRLWLDLKMQGLLASMEQSEG